MPVMSFCYSMVYWNFSGNNLQLSLYYQLSVWLILMIKWNIRMFAHTLAFHILYNNVTSKLTHKSISAQL